MRRESHSLLWAPVYAHPAAFTTVRSLRPRDIPLLLIAICFAAGVLCRGWWQPIGDVMALCITLILIAMGTFRWAPRLMPLTLALAWMSLGWAAALTESPGVDTSLLRYADGLQRQVLGRVTAVRLLPQRPVEQRQAMGRDALRDEENAFAAHEVERHAVAAVDVDVSAIEEVTPDVARMTPMHGGVEVLLLGSAAVPCGSTVLWNARLRKPRRYRDPGVWQYADLLATRGVVVESTADAAAITQDGKARWTWSCAVSGAQRWASNKLTLFTTSPMVQRLPRAMRLTTEDTAMLRAMLFGDRTSLDHGLRTVFERTGTFHLFVVAGMHVTLLLAAVYGGLLRLRVPRWVATIVASLLATGYAMLTGFGAPVQRALLMAVVYLLVRLLGRERSPLNALGGAMLAMLLLHPGALLEGGFQMTVLVIMAIAGIAVPIVERTLSPFSRGLREIRAVHTDERLQPRVAALRVKLRWIGDAMGDAVSPRWLAPFLRWAPAAMVRGLLLLLSFVMVTAVAEMVMALPMALYFHRLTPFAAPANLLALPLVGLLMGCAMVTFLASLLGAWIAVVPAAMTALLLHAVSGVVGVLGALRVADVRVPAPLTWVAVMAVAVWLLATVMVRERAARTGRIGLVIAVMAAVLVLLPRRPSLVRGDLEFTAIDVGQGDSLLVASPQGRTMLIDAGGPVGSPEQTAATNFDIGEEVVSPYLWSRGLRRLDVLVLTHAHTDHLGGMAAVMRNFRPKELWLSVDAATPGFVALMREADLYGVTVRHLHTGDHVAWGGATIAALSPAASYKPGSAPVNDDSLALLLQYGHSSVLEEGDAQAASERLIASEIAAPVTLLKVGHHGSNTSTIPALLAAARPLAAVISCGRGNRFGHPRQEVLERLQAASVQTARTDTMGAVQFLLKADGTFERSTFVEAKE